MSRVLASLMTLAFALLACTAPALAQAPAAPDTTLDRFLRSMQDSTDAYFGITAQHPDTTGLDSVLAYGLAHPKAQTGRRRGIALAYGPNLGFDRALGGLLGAEASLGLGRLGRLSGGAQYANGPNDWYGTARYRKHWRSVFGGDDEGGVTFEAEGGRDWRAFDRDHFDAFYSTLGALLYGSDRDDYLRRDGWHSQLAWQGARRHVSIAWRDELESPLVTTATWNLSHAALDKPVNAAATLGRVRELSFAGGLRWAGVPGAPLRAEGEYTTSDPRMGSDFRYRRTRFALGGDVALTRHVVFAPQIEWRRLRGEAVPQDALFLGGVGTLRTLDRNALQGTGAACARGELLLTDDVLALLHVPHPAALPLNVSAFGALGAVWGRDAATGIARPTARDWAERRDWLGEVGASVLYRSGVPDPNTYLRFDYAIPTGPDDARSAAWRISFQRPLNLLGARL